MNSTSKNETKFCKLSNGETIAYYDAGNPNTPVLVLLHGQMVGKACYDFYVIPQLAEHFRVLAIDMRGFGDSSYVKPVTALEELADDVNLFVESLNIPKFNLMGWSTGGAVAHTFAGKYPDRLEKLILLSAVTFNGIPFYRDKIGKPTERCDSLQDLMENNAMTFYSIEALKTKDIKTVGQACIKPMLRVENIMTDDDLNRMAELGLKQASVPNVFHLLNFLNSTDTDNGIYKANGYASKIRCKILILNGDGDYATPIAGAESMHKFFGEKSKLIVYPGGSHFLFFDSEAFRKKVSEDVIEFIKS